jgi:gliding motility-associated-like protein
MKQLLLILLLPVFSLGYSQGETNIWYFGNKAGLNFNSENPTAVTNGQLNTIEGCASLSDHQGNILFYTNGVNIWNKNHVVMQNGSGLFGDISSSQAAVIVQKPDSENIYYVFTTNAFENNGGFRYSIVDMSLNSGVGAVTSKNILLYDATCEKISIIRHKNGHDLWVVSHQWNTNGFYAHLITASGISPASVISNSGITVTADDDKAHAIGYMKISADGSKLVACHTYLNTAELFDFDTATGLVSNPVTLVSDEHPYGVEFSPNGHALYLSVVDEKKIFRFDLQAGDIAASKALLANLPNIPGALQLGPNGKIYIAMAETDKLSVINNPDETAGNCGVQINSVDLDGRMCMLGLPSFNQSFLNTYVDVQTACGNEASFTMHTPQNVNMMVWDFGDSNTSTDINATHTYAAAGDYTITATATTISGTVSKTQNVKIVASAAAALIANKNFCIDANSVYDLSENDAILLNGQSASVYGTAYFTSLAAAQNHVNMLPVNYPLTVGTVTIYAKVYKLSDPSCNALTSFTITSYLIPVAAEDIEDYTTCDTGTVDGITTFDLNTKTAEITNNQVGLAVTYFAEASDAENNVSPLTMIYTNAYNSQTIYARIENGNGCFTVASFKLIANDCSADDTIIFPHFFTPNGDGYNDLWQITSKTGGTSKTKINIFDRYGKLIKSMVYGDSGWDGTISGAQLPSDDYWYVVDAENGKQYKGHFAMKR